MNPAKPAAWRSFCPQFNRGLTFQLVLNLGKGHCSTPCGLKARPSWSKSAGPWTAGRKTGGPATGGWGTG